MAPKASSKASATKRKSDAPKSSWFIGLCAGLIPGLAIGGWCIADSGRLKWLEDYLMVEVPNGFQGCLEGNCMDGWGVKVVQDKKYEGQFKQPGALQHGQGVTFFASGDVYEGQYSQNLENGLGVYTFADGSTYAGEWANGFFAGVGVFNRSTGQVFSGEYKKDDYEGSGVLIFNDGQRYEGDFDKGKRHGMGRFHSLDGNLYEGRYEKSAQKGGRFQLSNGQERKGPEWSEATAKLVNEAVTKAGSAAERARGAAARAAETARWTRYRMKGQRLLQYVKDTATR